MQVGLRVGSPTEERTRASVVCISFRLQASSGTKTADSPLARILKIFGAVMSFPCFIFFFVATIFVQAPPIVGDRSVPHAPER